MVSMLEMTYEPFFRNANMWVRERRSEISSRDSPLTYKGENCGHDEGLGTFKVSHYCRIVHVIQCSKYSCFCFMKVSLHLQMANGHWSHWPIEGLLVDVISYHILLVPRGYPISNSKHFVGKTRRRFQHVGWTRSMFFSGTSFVSLSFLNFQCSARRVTWRATQNTIVSILREYFTKWPPSTSYLRMVGI